MDVREFALPAKVAVIGSSGFVGSTLCRQVISEGSQVFGFNSNSTDEDLRRQEFDLVLVAAPHAKKWWANSNSIEDEILIRDLVKRLSLLRGERVILYSTIDVFPQTNGVDETFDCSGNTEPYGRNRFLLEEQLRGLFTNLTVIRLPGLFGEGLKKNVLFDLLNQRMLENISPRSTFQWYGLEHLWTDTKRVLSIGESLVAFNSEPISNRVLVRQVFPELEPLLPRFSTEESGSFVSYNVHSRFAFHWTGNVAPFMRDQENVLEHLLRWKRCETHQD